ncbi:MAG: enoyl-[acyl-carrier protein] reductase I, partial [Gammaproteobacteria bacterium]
MSFMKGKKVLIAGVASTKSIAWGIAQAMHQQGAEIAFSYPNDKLKPRVEKMAAELGSTVVLPCDVSTDAQIEGLFTQLADHWDGLDCVIHSIAYAPKEELEGEYIDAVTREGFITAHEISSYSFAAMAKYAQPLMEGRNGSLLTLSYIGAVLSMPSYNVMGVAKASLEANVRYLAQSLGSRGIRVNAISAGPIRTLAAAGIKDFRKLLAQFEKMAPLGRVVTIEEVGNAAA